MKGGGGEEDAPPPQAWGPLPLVHTLLWEVTAVGAGFLPAPGPFPGDRRRPLPRPPGGSRGRASPVRGWPSRLHTLGAAAASRTSPRPAGRGRDVSVRNVPPQRDARAPPEQQRAPGGDVGFGAGAAPGGGVRAEVGVRPTAVGKGGRRGRDTRGEGAASSPPRLRRMEVTTAAAEVTSCWGG